MSTFLTVQDLVNRATKHTLCSEIIFSEENGIITVTHDKDSWSCPSDSDPHEFAMKVSLGIEDEINGDDFDERWSRHYPSTYEMGEPGYDYDHILLGDWWERKDGELTNVTDSFEFAVDLRRLFPGTDPDRILISWDDEWGNCQECYRAYRTTHDSYTWRSSCAIHEAWDEYVCESCIREGGIASVREFLQQFHNNPKSAMVFDWDLEKYGYVRYNGTYQSGWHTGMNDDPHIVLERLQKLGFHTVIFSVPHVSQFHVNFETWVPEHEVLEWDQGNPIGGVGLPCAMDRFVKITDPHGLVTFTTMDELLEDLDLDENSHRDRWNVLMCLQEGESTSYRQLHDEEMSIVVRVTEDCFDKHTA